jgi:hypothetical protein
MLRRGWDFRSPGRVGVDCMGRGTPKIMMVELSGSMTPVVTCGKLCV